MKKKNQGSQIDFKLVFIHTAESVFRLNLVKIKAEIINVFFFSY